jgi:hypothetical protein
MIYDLSTQKGRNQYAKALETPSKPMIQPQSATHKIAQAIRQGKSSLKLGSQTLHLPSRQTSGTESQKEAYVQMASELLTKRAMESPDKKVIKYYIN